MLSPLSRLYRAGQLLHQRHHLALVALALLALAFLGSRYLGTHYYLDGNERGQGTYAPYLAVQDGHKMFLQAHSLVFDQDLDIDNQVERYGYVGFRWRTDDGRAIYPHGIGVVMVWAPVLLGAHVVVRLGNLAGADIATDGYGLFHQRIVFASSVLFAWLTALLGYFLCKRLLGGRFAPPLSALAILLGTNLYYYGTLRPDLSHAMSALACGAFLSYWALTLGRWDRRRMVTLGLVLGACALIRSANAFHGMVLVVEVAAAGAYSLRHKEWAACRALIAMSALALASTVLVFAIQLLVWKFHYESGFFRAPHGQGYVHLGRPMLAEFLSSGLNGFWSTHPLAYLGSIGLLLAPRRMRLIAIAFAVALLVQIYVNACVYDWWGMGSFGARRMCNSSLILIVGLCALFHRMSLLLRVVPREARVLLASLLVAWMVIWNVSLAGPARERVRVEPIAMCCKHLPGWMARLAEPIDERYGNPFAFPANALHAWRYQVPLRKWQESVIGKYAGRPDFHDLRRGKADGREYRWNIPGVHFDPFLIEGLGPRQRVRMQPKAAVDANGKRPAGPTHDNFRWTVAPRARFFLPLFLPRSHRIEWPMRGNLGPGDPSIPVRIYCNDELVFAADIDASFQVARFEIPAHLVRRGQNLIVIESEPRPYRERPDAGELALPAHPSKIPVGLAVAMMRLWVDKPAR